MHNKKRIVGVILARGGSKGVPRKNIRLLCGKPLLYYTIAAAKQSWYLDQIILSTEDDEIAAIGRGYGVEIIVRPPELATDETSAYSVYQHALLFLDENTGYQTDIVVGLQPTTPLRLAQDIDGAIETFLACACDTVATVCEVEHPPQWMFRIENGRIEPLFEDWQRVSRRQIVDSFYRLNGAVYVFHRRVLTEQDMGIMGNDIRPYIMPVDRSVDIDTESDFMIAEFLLNKKRGHL